MKKKVLALYRGKIFEPRGTPIRIFNILSRLEKEPSIELHVFSWDKEAPLFKNHTYLPNNHRKDILNIAKYTREHQIDLILGYTASSLFYIPFLKFMTKAKISFESHGFIEDEALEYNDIGWLKYRAYKIFFGFCYWLCDFVMTSDGPSVGRVLEKYNKKTLLLTGGADLDFFRPDVPSGTYIKKDNRIVIGYAGNARVWQGVDFLIECYHELLKTHPDFRLALLTSEKKNFGSNVEVYGPVPNTEVPKFLIDCDILVIPRPRTLVTEIAYPSKLTEYLAMGKAVVGSNVGDMDVIIKSGENGLIYEAGNKDALVKALVELRDPILRAKLGKNGLETARNLSWKKVVAKLVAYLEEVL